MTNLELQESTGKAMVQALHVAIEEARRHGTKLVFGFRGDVIELGPDELDDFIRQNATEIAAFQLSLRQHKEPQQ